MAEKIWFEYECEPYIADEVTIKAVKYQQSAIVGKTWLSKSSVTIPQSEIPAFIEFLKGQVAA